MNLAGLGSLINAASKATDMGDVVFADRWAIEVRALDDTRAVVCNWDNVPNTRYLILTDDSVIAADPAWRAIAQAMVR